MSLLKCEKCGGPISDKAMYCPHCGTMLRSNSQSSKDETPSIETRNESKSVYANNEKKNYQASTKMKAIAWFLIAVTMVAIASTVYIFFLFEEEKKMAGIESEMLAKKEKRMQQFADSLYRNFTSNDLKMMDAKGFVKSIDFVEKSSTDTLFHVYMVFNKEGEIVDIKSHADFDSKKMHVMNIVRTQEGRIENINFRTSKLTTDSYGTHYCESLPRYSFEYDNYSGHICKIKTDDKYDIYGLSETSIEYCFYDKGKGYTSRKMSYWYTMDCSSTHNATFNQHEIDSVGNWIYKSGTDKVVDECDSGVNKSTHKIEQIRAITYYAKDQIKFSSFIKE